MGTFGKRLKKNITRNLLLDRELDFLPATVNRDEVREIARRYGPLQRRSLIGKLFTGLIGFLFRYGLPLVGMIIGAEYQAARALQPLIGKEQRYGDSLRIFLGESMAKKVEDTTNSFKMAGALIAATPEIIFWALYGAAAGICLYLFLRWSLMLTAGYRRKRKLNRRIRDLVGYL
jgi:hypothetical protein